MVRAAETDSRRLQIDLLYSSHPKKVEMPDS
jgi:hypothetical protein